MNVIPPVGGGVYQTIPGQYDGKGLDGVLIAWSTFTYVLTSIIDQVEGDIAEMSNL